MSEAQAKVLKAVRDGARLYHSQTSGRPFVSVPRDSWWVHWGTLRSLCKRNWLEHVDGDWTAYQLTPAGRAAVEAYEKERER